MGTIKVQAVVLVEFLEQKSKLLADETSVRCGAYITATRKTQEVLNALHNEDVGKRKVEKKKT